MPVRVAADVGQEVATTADVPPAWREPLIAGLLTRLEVELKRDNGAFGIGLDDLNVVTYCRADSLLQRGDLVVAADETLLFGKKLMDNLPEGDAMKLAIYRVPRQTVSDQRTDGALASPRLGSRRRLSLVRPTPLRLPIEPDLPRRRRALQRRVSVAPYCSPRHHEDGGGSSGLTPTLQAASLNAEILTEMLQKGTAGAGAA
jgi:hypothetical protein